MKERLLNYIKSILEERMKVARDEMESAQLSANEETKSSAGDKYETGRAMAQNQRDMYARQYQQILSEKQVLDRIDPVFESVRVIVGSYVSTSGGDFFISVSIGHVHFEGTQVMVVSPVSPIGKLLMGKEKQEKVNFQNKTITITDIR
jgi:transcription elongation GreA/GreB family factor